jgi:hypothetical protein
VIATGPEFEVWSDALLAELPPLEGDDAQAVGRLTAGIDARRNDTPANAKRAATLPERATRPTRGSIS